MGSRSKQQREKNQTQKVDDDRLTHISGFFFVVSAGDTIRHRTLRKETTSFVWSFESRCLSISLEIAEEEQYSEYCKDVILGLTF